MIEEFVTKHIISLIVFLIGFTIGFAAGILTQRKMSKMTDKAIVLKREHGAWVLIFLIGVLYTASVVADIIVEGYDTPFALHGIMGMSVGYALEAKLSDVAKIFTRK